MVQAQKSLKSTAIALEGATTLNDLLEILKADQTPGGIEIINKSLEQRCLKSKGHLNQMVAVRKRSADKLRKLRAQLGLLDREIMDESEIASRLPEPSTSFLSNAMDSELDLAMSSSFSKVETTVLGDTSGSLMNPVSYEAQKSRIQQNIELQLYKAMEEERIGQSYKHIYR